MTKTRGATPAGRRASLMVRMTNAAREAGVVPRRIHLLVGIDRLLARLLQAAPGQWVVKGGYANALRRPHDARFTEDLDLKIEAEIETATELLASGFAVHLGDDFSYEVATSPVSLEGPPGGGLRFDVVARLAGTELVRFKVDVSASDGCGSPSIRSGRPALGRPTLQHDLGVGWIHSIAPNVRIPSNQVAASDTSHYLVWPRDDAGERGAGLFPIADGQIRV